jgi:hypothetical protein
LVKQPKAKKPKPPEKPQGERFKEFARSHGAEEDVLDRALREVGKAKPKKGG